MAGIGRVHDNGVGYHVKQAVHAPRNRATARLPLSGVKEPDVTPVASATKGDIDATIVGWIYDNVGDRTSQRKLISTANRIDLGAVPGCTRAVKAVNAAAHSSGIQPGGRGEGKRLDTIIQAITSQSIIWYGLPSAPEYCTDPRANRAKSHKVSVRSHSRAARIGGCAGKGNIYTSIGVARAAIGGAADAAPYVGA